jgi:hypothetical protein
MAEMTEAQRVKRRAYMKKWNAKRRQEKEELAAWDARALEAAHAPRRLKADPVALAEKAEKKARGGGPRATRLAYMIPRLVDLTLALRKAGCRMAICTFADGSKITLR